MSELRYALRTLTRTPGFACVAVLSLALGIGANAAIYSLIREVLLQPLPVRAPEELVAVGWRGGSAPRGSILSIGSTAYRDERSGLSYGSNFSYTLYRAFQETGANVFAFSYAASDISVSFGGQPVVASGLLVSGNYFAQLGVTTVVGRPLEKGDDAAEAAPAAVITYAFWRRVFGGDPGVLQRTIVVNGSPFTIVGVTAPGFYGMSKGGPFFKPTDVFLPLAVQPLVYTRSTPRSLFSADDRWWIQVMARVKPGTPMAPIETALNRAFRRSLGASPVPALQAASAGEVRLFRAPRGLDSWTRGLRQPLFILGGVVGVVLLIACVNVANLMLVRGVARQKEVSIRLALGASRWRVVRATLAESALLACAGGALGLLVGVWGARILLVSVVAGRASTALDISLDRGVVGVTAIVSALAALFFSAVPAARTAAGGIAPALRRVSTGASAPALNAGRILMAAQVAISIPLLVGAALFLRTVYNLAQVELGFNPAQLVIFHLDPSLNGYDADRVERLYERTLPRLAAIPGVQSATLTDIVLISRSQNNWPFVVPGKEPVQMKFARIGPGYFDTFGIPVLAGRGIGVQDHSRAPRVAVVNETAARTLFGSLNAVGELLTMEADRRTDFAIVGVVKDARYTSPRDPMPPVVYLPYAQTAVGRLGAINVVVRSSLAPATLGPLLRSTMAEVDGNVPITDLRTQTDQIDDTLGTERTFLRLLLAFGAFALLLASIGLHAVTAYSVLRRTREIGVRVALGARQADVLWMVLRQVVGITALGFAIGVPGAIALTRFVRASLYGVEPADPASVAGAVVVMAMVAVLAGYFPARRAARLDPLIALRHD